MKNDKEKKSVCDIRKKYNLSCHNCKYYNECDNIFKINKGGK